METDENWKQLEIDENLEQCATKLYFKYLGEYLYPNGDIDIRFKWKKDQK